MGSRASWREKEGEGVSLGGPAPADQDVLGLLGNVTYPGLCEVCGCGRESIGTALE